MWHSWRLPVTKIHFADVEYLTGKNIASDLREIASGQYKIGGCLAQVTSRAIG